MILYPGLDPVTIFPGTPATGYGFFSGPQVAEGGDLRSAANLMAASEALTDRANFLGWRCINIVDGGTYTFTSGISIKNAFTFTGAGTIATTAAWALDGTFTISSVGVMTIAADGTLNVQGTSGHPGKIAVKQYAKLDVESGGTLTGLSGSTVILGGTVVIDKVVAKNADPGADDVMCGANVPKAWATVTTDGAGGVTLDDGYNIDTVAFLTAPPSGSIVVTLKRAMADDKFAVVNTILGGNSYVPRVGVKTASTFTISAGTALGATTTLDLTANAETFMVVVFGRQ